VSGYLIDTNVLVRLLLPHDPLCPVATSAIDELKQRGEKACLAPQNLIEFWSVSTRPVEVNGLGLRPERVSAEIDRIEKMFRVLDEVPTVYRRWRSLVDVHAVRGRQAHDARLVALMIEHEIDNILTFNVDDVTRYVEVVAVSPHDLVEPQVAGGSEETPA
jgi:predicted nucleic acid-binding protein